jgi:hypothetical protein
MIMTIGILLHLAFLEFAADSNELAGTGGVCSLSRQGLGADPASATKLARKTAEGGE